MFFLFPDSILIFTFRISLSFLQFSWITNTTTACLLAYGWIKTDHYDDDDDKKMNAEWLSNAVVNRAPNLNRHQFSYQFCSLWIYNISTYPILTKTLNNPASRLSPYISAYIFWLKWSGQLFFTYKHNICWFVVFLYSPVPPIVQRIHSHLLSLPPQRVFRRGSLYLRIVSASAWLLLIIKNNIGKLIKTSDE